jgi:hypothetical protein
MDTVIPTPRWARKGGLYEPRFSLSITGETWHKYEELQRNPAIMDEREIRLEACKIPLPVDICFSSGLLSHQISLFEGFRLLALADDNNFEASKDVMDIVESKIFYGDGLFNLALPGSFTSSSYADPSFKMLLPYYNFLSLLSDIVSPGPLYDHLDQPTFIFKVRHLIAKTPR